MACLISPTITIKMPPPTPPETIWPMIDPISRPPAAASAPVPPPTSAPMIWAPTPPPITPAIELPRVPRLYCFNAEPAMKQYNLGTLGNSIAGVIGGGVGAQIIGALVGGGTGAEAAAGGLDIGSIIGQIVSGGVGGGILMVIVGLIKQAMGGQPAS